MRGSSIRIGLILASSLVLALALHGCGPGPSGQKNVLHVGAILSTSGPAAAYGSETEKGAELAYEALSKSKLPFTLKYTLLDDKTDKTEAIKAAHTLVDLNNVQAILGPAISPSALSVGKYADERGIPMITTSATLDTVTVSDTYDRKFVFRVCFNDGFQGRVLAAFVSNRLHKLRAAIIYDSTAPYSIGLAKIFRTEFEKRGGTVAYTENYSVADTDYSALIGKVARYDVDVLFIPGWDENVGPMIKQAAGRWNRFILIGGDGWPTNRLLQLAGPDIPKAYALSHFINDDPNPEVQKFVKAYRAKYGSDPSPFAALGYDALNLIVDAGRRSKTLAPSEIRDAIERTKGLRLVTGTISFDRQRNPQKDGVIVSVAPSGFHYYDRVPAGK